MNHAPNVELAVMRRAAMGFDWPPAETLMERAPTHATPRERLEAMEVGQEARFIAEPGQLVRLRKQVENAAYNLTKKLGYRFRSRCMPGGVIVRRAA